MNPGKLLIEIGLLFVIMGGILILISKLGGPRGFPLDVVIEKGNTRIYLLLGTSLFLSLVLTLVLNLILFLIGKK